jgi:hypothetical protein
MRTIRLLLIPALLIAIAGSAYAQQRQQGPQQRQPGPQRGGQQGPQRSRGPQRNNTNTNPLYRPQRGGNYTFTSKSLPAEYSVLLTRTIFARNHEIPQENTQARAPQPPRRTEYIFRGTMIENGTTFLAGIENRSSNHTIFLTQDGSLPALNLRVTTIALDHLIVTDRNGRRLINIGESLDAGTQIANPATLPTIANGPRPTEEPQ